MISCLLAFCIVLFSCCVASAESAETSLSVAASRVTQKAGEDVTFTFVLDNPGKKSIEGIQFSLKASAGLSFKAASLASEVTGNFQYSNYSNDRFTAVIGNNVTSTAIELLSVTYTVRTGTPAEAILPVSVDRTKEVQILTTVQSGAAWNTEELSCDISQAFASVTVSPCAGGHALSSGEVTKAPTCTEAGERRYICSVCGYSVTEEIPALGHSPTAAVRENKTAASCTGQGKYEEVIVCSDCGKELARTTKGSPALGHDWGEWTVIQQATGENDGVMRRVCRRDGSHMEERVIPRQGHTHTVVRQEEISPTCTEDGTAAHWRCSVCGARFEDENGSIEISEESLRIQAEGHSMGSCVETMTQKESCTEDGIRTIETLCDKCGICYETGTEIVPAHGHSPGEPTEENRIPASETEAGHYDEVVSCTLCHTEISRRTVYELFEEASIISHPSDALICVGDLATFGVVADGSSLKYQWQESGDGGVTWSDSTESGNRSATLRLTAATVLNGKQFRCLVSNPGGTVISGAATLSVTGALITEQPKDVTIEEGSRATFTVKATGSGLTYRWQISKDTGKTWEDCTGTGSDTDSYSLLPRASSSGWKYRCQITGTGMTVVSDSVLLTVTVPKNKPVFKAQNLVLSGQIGVNFYLDLSTVSSSDRSKSYMEFTVGESSPMTVPFDAEKKNGNGYFGFTCYVKSIQMADTITAVFHYGSGKTVAREYSVASYIEAVNRSADSFDATTLALVRAVADYGHYAQTYLASENGWIIGKDYSEMSLFYASSYNYADILSRVQANAFVKAIDGSNVTKATYKLHLDSETTVDVFLTMKSGTAPKDVTLTIYEQLSGNTIRKTVAPVKQSDGRYLIRISGISAHKLGDTISISGEAGKMFTVEVSALSYVRSVLNNSTSTEMAKNALSALYAYYAATMAYRETHK